MEDRSMTDEELALGFGMTRQFVEGAVAHPADIYTNCGCEKCEQRWQEQLAAWKAAQ